MTQQETNVCAQLLHWLELHGPTVNPKAVIDSIIDEVAPKKRAMRNQLEDVLFDQWALLCAEEGDE